MQDYRTKHEIHNCRTTSERTGLSNGVKIIVNPQAGYGRTQVIWEEIEGKIKKLGISYSSIFTKALGHATKLAQDAVKEGFREIFVVGGDGTINEVANGIDLNKVVLGVIPTGSGNDLAKMLGVRSIKDGLSSLQYQYKKRIDLGRALGRLFVNNLGIGFDALVVSSQKKLKAFKGNLSYLVATLKVLKGFRGYTVEIKAEECSFSERIISVSVGNGQFHGGCFRLTPEAVIDDGFLDVCIIPQINKLRFIFNIPKALKGTHTRLKEAKFFKTTKFFLSSSEPLFVHFDGEAELNPIKNIEVEVLPASLEIFVGVNPVRKSLTF